MRWSITRRKPMSSRPTGALLRWFDAAAAAVSGVDPQSDGIDWARIVPLWWEIDITFFLLRCLAPIGVIWDLKPVPVRVLLRHATGRSRPA